MDRESGVEAAIDAAREELSGANPPFPTSLPAQVRAIEPQSALVQGQIHLQAQPGNRTAALKPAAVSGGRMDSDAETDKAGASQSQNALSAEERPAAGGVARPTDQIEARNVEARNPHQAQVGGLAGQVNHPSGAQANSPAGDPAAMVRDPAGTQGSTATIGQDAGGTAGAMGPAAQETFAALDQGTHPGTPSWVHAGVHRAEAGFQDPALGWVGVRADTSGGQIHATLMPGSADAAQALGGHMAGLNAYLDQVHAPVGTLTLAAPGGREAGLGTGQDQGAGMSHEMNQGMHQGMSQNAGQGGSPEPPLTPQPVRPAIGGAVPVETHILAGNSTQAAGTYGQTGSHISVMA